MFKFILFIFIAFLYLIIPKKSINIKFIHLKKYIIMTIILVIMISIIVFSEKSYETAKNGFMLWVNNIIPSLLPFFICIELLKKTEFIDFISKILNPIMRPIFNVPGAGAFAIAMGITSGYPVGAKMATELYLEQKCTKTEAERLLSFTNTSGPLFIIGTVGIGIFSSPQIGLLLLLTHFLASITVGFVFRKYKKSDCLTENIIAHKSQKIKDNETITLSNMGYYMGNAIQNSISTLLLICGYIVFFAVFSEILENYNVYEFAANTLNPIFALLNLPNDFLNIIIRGALEVTNGLEELSLLIPENIVTCVIVASFILGFGGISVLMQTASIVSEAKLSLKPYILGKLLHGLFAALFTYLAIKYTSFFSFNVVKSFSYNVTSPLILNETSNLISVLSTLILLTFGTILYRKIT